MTSWHVQGDGGGQSNSRIRHTPQASHYPIGRTVVAASYFYAISAEVNQGNMVWKQLNDLHGKTILQALSVPSTLVHQIVFYHAMQESPHFELNKEKDHEFVFKKRNPADPVYVHMQNLR